MKKTDDVTPNLRSQAVLEQVSDHFWTKLTTETIRERFEQLCAKLGWQVTEKNQAEWKNLQFKIIPEEKNVDAYATLRLELLKQEDESTCIEIGLAQGSQAIYDESIRLIFAEPSLKASV